MLNYLLSFERGVVYINQQAVPIVKRKVDLYITEHVNVKDKPKGDNYSRWLDSIFKARGQISLLVELATLRGGGVWDRDVEGTLIT